MKKQALFIANGIVEDKLGVSGGEVRFIEIAKGWSKRGYTINLLSNPNGKEICSAFGVKVVLHRHNSLSSKTRLNFLYKTLSSFFLPKSLENFENTKSLVYSTNEQLYDVIPGLVLKIKSLLKKNSSIKWGVVVHWLPPYMFWTRKESTLLNSLFFLISERLSLYTACLFADTLFAVSDSTKRQIERDILARFFINKVKVVYCGVDLDLINGFRKDFDKVEKKYDAVFMKRLQAVKGVFDLVSIWKQVVKKKPTAKLLIIGSGPDEQLLREKINEQGLNANIILAGPVLDMKEKYQNIIQSKVFILPSYEENWAIVIGEAIASGVPVVTYDLSELQSVWKDSITYASLADTKEFANKIIKLLEMFNAASYISLKKEGLEYIKQYSWDTISGNELKYLVG